MPNGDKRMRRHAAEAGLQAEVAAERGRDAHAAGAVGADRQRAQAGGHRRGGAARRTARRLARVPRVARDAGAAASWSRPCSRTPACWSCRATPRRPRAARGGRRIDVPRLRWRRRCGCRAAWASRWSRIRSLIDVGTPSSAPHGSPRCQRASLARADAIASPGGEVTEREQLGVDCVRCAPAPRWWLPPARPAASGTAPTSRWPCSRPSRWVSCGLLVGCTARQRRLARRES